MRRVELDTIKKALEGVDLLPAMEQGYRDYSNGLCNIPPVGELLMESGEVHIKYGCVQGDSTYLIKIASSFPGNSKHGMPAGDGMMLVFSQDSGALECMLVDQGYLTDRRTAAAGAVAAKYLGPEQVQRIGIVGTGVQARMQLLELKDVTPCTEVMVWGRNPDRAQQFCQEMQAKGYDISAAAKINEIAATCNLIVTTTTATQPLLSADMIRPGTHISAMGSDTPHKQELDSQLLARADRVVADSIEQSLLRGEIFKALEDGSIQQDVLVEMGQIISGDAPARTDEEQITIFDSTGVAVQDIRIAALVLRRL